jgi:hypothetical protein
MMWRKAWPTGGTVSGARADAWKIDFYLEKEQ